MFKGRRHVAVVERDARGQEPSLVTVRREMEIIPRQASEAKFGHAPCRKEGRPGCDARCPPLNRVRAEPKKVGVIAVTRERRQELLPQPRETSLIDHLGRSGQSGIGGGEIASEQMGLYQRRDEPGAELRVAQLLRPCFRKADECGLGQIPRRDREFEIRGKRLGGNRRRACGESREDPESLAVSVLRLVLCLPKLDGNAMRPGSPLDEMANARRGHHVAARLERGRYARTEQAAKMQRKLGKRNQDGFGMVPIVLGIRQKRPELRTPRATLKVAQEVAVGYRSVEEPSHPRKTICIGVIGESGSQDGISLRSEAQGDVEPRECKCRLVVRAVQFPEKLLPRSGERLRRSTLGGYPARDVEGGLGRACPVLQARSVGVRGSRSRVVSR